MYQNNFARVTSEPKKPFKGSITQKTSYNDFVLMRKDFLTLVGAPNESLRLMTIYFTFKYLFGIKKTLPDLLRSQNSPLKAQFG